MTSKKKQIKKLKVELETAKDYMNTMQDAFVERDEYIKSKLDPMFDSFIEAKYPCKYRIKTKNSVLYRCEIIRIKADKEQRASNSYIPTSVCLNCVLRQE